LQPFVTLRETATRGGSGQSAQCLAAVGLHAQFDVSVAADLRPFNVDLNEFCALRDKAPAAKNMPTRAPSSITRSGC